MFDMYSYGNECGSVSNGSTMASVRTAARILAIASLEFKPAALELL
jgi:hypothetical protein